eukprot:1305863-Pyramimonas_sp.AAC.1
MAIVTGPVILDVVRGPARGTPGAAKPAARQRAIGGGCQACRVAAWDWRRPHLTSRVSAMFQCRVSTPTARVELVLLSQATTPPPCTAVSATFAAAAADQSPLAGTDLMPTGVPALWA